MTTHPTEELQQHTWKLVEIDINGTLQPVPPECLITLQFGEESRVYGKSACNRYFSTCTIDVDDFHLHFGNTGATRMMCPEALMALENAYFAAMQHVESYQLQAEQLLLYDGQGKMLLRFQNDVGA